jgi:hypothetical protein
MQSVGQTCARCERPREQWHDRNGQGYEKDGKGYCCRGCAENTGCTCMTGVAGK